MKDEKLTLLWGKDLLLLRRNCGSSSARWPLPITEGEE